jgi:hypothetical protein
MPFDESKLTKPVREWLDDHFDYIPAENWPAPKRSEFIASAFESRVNLAKRLVKTGRTDVEIERILRGALQSELNVLRQHPKYDRRHEEFYNEVISQAVQVGASSRGRADDRVKARKEAKTAAERAAEKAAWEQAMDEEIATA